MTALRTARLAAGVWTLGVLVALSIPGVFLPEVRDGLPALLHATFFAGLGFLWTLAIPKHVGAVALGLLAMTVGTELWQLEIIPDRSAQWGDVAADVVGLAIGLAMAAPVRRHLTLAAR